MPVIGGKHMLKYYIHIKKYKVIQTTLIQMEKYMQKDRGIICGSPRKLVQNVS
jgi:hypothetical protein